MYSTSSEKTYPTICITCLGGSVIVHILTNCLNLLSISTGNDIVTGNKKGGGSAFIFHEAGFAFNWFSPRPIF